MFKKKKNKPNVQPQNSSPFRLTVHVGAGKTGTSSIQRTLLTNQSKLNVQGVHYLGIMLEQAPVKRYSWQIRRGTEKFFELDDETRLQEALEILRDSVENFQEQEISHAIWSNESFLKRSAMVMDILRQLSDDGIDIKIVAYVRRHDAWMKSAYIQWGLKHKSYKGKIKSFDEWALRSRADFALQLKSWISVFDKRVIVRNFDAAGDAVADFMNIVGMGTDGLENIRDNVAPGYEELFLRALFNAQHHGKASPNKFNKILKSQSLDFGSSIDVWLKQLLPDENALRRMQDDYADDREALNELLEKNGQPSVDTTPLPEKPIHLDISKLLMTLTQIVMNQAVKSNAMQEKLDNLTTGELKSIQVTASAANSDKTGVDYSGLEKPVFVISSGRSGSTLVQRLLNCHKDLVIWGEHFGFLKGLTNSYSQMSKKGQKQYPRNSAENKGPQQLLPTLQDPAAPIEWSNPWSFEEHKERLKTFITDYFASRLESAQRWGFKEIRYNNTSSLRMLEDLFPEAKFIFIKRDPIEVTRSKVFAFIKESRWDDFSNSQKSKRIAQMLTDVNDHYSVYDQFMERNSNRAMLVHYENLVAQPKETTAAMLSHLDLDPEDYDWALAEQVMSNIITATKRDDEVLGLIRNIFEANNNIKG